MSEFGNDSIIPSNRNVRRISVDHDAPDYKMDRKKRTAVIFNHFKFNNGTHISGIKLKDRLGTDKDIERLKEVLDKFHFKVHVYNDFKLHQIHDKIQELKNKDFSGEDCLAIFVLTHGIERKLAAHDYLYDSEDLWRFFSGNNCPTLVGKPKLIFINACQGDGKDTGVPVTYHPHQDGSKTSGNSFYKIPCMADVLIAHSSFEGYVSFREETGSWFIQSFCDNLSNDIIGKMELKEILTRTSRQVANMIARNVERDCNYNGATQVPTIISTLLRNLYLKNTNTV